MLDFSDLTRTGISILTSAAGDEYRRSSYTYEVFDSERVLETIDEALYSEQYILEAPYLY